jgi:hypothetical protein
LYYNTKYSKRYSGIENTEIIVFFFIKTERSEMVRAHGVVLCGCATFSVVVDFRVAYFAAVDIGTDFDRLD